MTSGIFALIGVLLGGTVTGTVTWTLERKREKATARAACRLLLEEFSRNLARIMSARRHRDTARAVLAEIEGPVWGEHRNLLARTLDDREWAAITTAWMLVEASATFGAADDVRPLEEHESATIGGAAAALEAALSVLAQRALPKHPSDLGPQLEQARDVLDLYPRD